MITDQTFPATRSSRAYVGDTTLAEAGVAQNLFQGSICDMGFAIYNPDASNDLWISCSGVASPNAPGSICVPAGGGYETPSHYRPNGPVSVFGAVGGQPITASGW